MREARWALCCLLLAGLACTVEGARDAVQQALDFIQKVDEGEEPRYVNELVQLLSIPSVSALPRHLDDCKRAAQWLSFRLLDAGLDHVQMISGDLAGPRPVVYADWVNVPDAPTVLIYGGCTGATAGRGRVCDRRQAVDTGPPPPREAAAAAAVALLLLQATMTCSRPTQCRSGTPHPSSPPSAMDLSMHVARMMTRETCCRPYRWVQQAAAAVAAAAVAAGRQQQRQQ